MKYLCRLLALYLLCTTSAIAQENDKQVNYLWMTIPDHPWAFMANTPGFVLDHIGLGKNDRGGWSRSIQAHNDKTGLIVSAFIEEEKVLKDVSSIRNDQWTEERKRSMELSDFKLIDREGLIGVEYIVKSFQGHQVNQKGMHFYWVKDSSWVELHISKILFKTGDEALFEQIYKNVSFMPGSDPEVIMLVSDGSNAFYKRNYKTAINNYQKVVDHEKLRRSLRLDKWRIVVDNLGMAYGITGDLEKSMETYNYGISNDPTHPNFHYSLACTYAEMKKLDLAIESLKTAYSYKSNVIQGETMPDPRTDDSFSSYLSDEKFARALKELGLE